MHYVTSIDLAGAIFVDTSPLPVKYQRQPGYEVMACIRLGRMIPARFDKIQKIQLKTKTALLLQKISDSRFD